MLATSLIYVHLTSFLIYISRAELLCRLIEKAVEKIGEVKQEMVEKQGERSQEIR